MRLAPLFIAMLGVTLVQAACSDPSESTVSGDTSEVFFPDTTGNDATQAESTDTALPETTDTALPETTDTSRPETTDTALPETGDTNEPTDTTLPETTDTVEPDPDTTAPSGWTCSAEFYGDTDCDCGCGIIDVDCPAGATAAECDYCTACSAGTDCEEALVAGDISQCVVPECGDNVATLTEVSGPTAHPVAWGA